MSEKRSTKCSKCGEKLEDNNNEPCPKCGSIYTTTEVKIDVPPIGLSAKLNEIESIKRGRDVKYPWLVVTLILICGAPFLGLYVTGFVGVILGIVIGISASYTGYKSIKQTKETDRDRFNYE